MADSSQLLIERILAYGDGSVSYVQAESKSGEVLLGVLKELSAAMNAVGEGVLVIDDEGNVVFCNESFNEIFCFAESPVGSSIGSVLRRGGRFPRALYSEELYQALEELTDSANVNLHLSSPGDEETEKVVCQTLLLRCSFGEGALRFCCLRKLLRESAIQEKMLPVWEVVEENRALVRLNAQLRIENAERQAVAQALRRAESRYRDIVDNATEGIFQWTPGWNLLSVNVAFAQMLGYSTVNSLLTDTAEHSFRLCYAPQVEVELMAMLERKGYIVNFEFQISRYDGTPLWASMNARRVVGRDGATGYYEAFIENISSRKSTEEKLVYQAFHDPLTGLANRALFHDRLSMALRRSQRQKHYRFAVLYLDLDRFKLVNDSFGHNMGDRVLCRAAAGILGCVREVDTVARFGGDEFAVLLEEVDKPAFAVQVARRIHSTLNKPFDLKDQEINIGGSIGIVLNGETYEHSEDILRDVDTAMYRAKAERGTGLKVFSRKMRDEIVNNIVFETDIRTGIKSGEFFAEYQPVVYMATGELYGFEALLRWNRKGTLVGPGAFIPVAEDCGLIKELGLHVIEEVCKQVVRWNSAPAGHFVTHLNISGRQLVYPTFFRDVEYILNSTGVAPEHLIFEITESVLLDNGGACIQAIKKIRELGIQFCLDDFGTGFSSLSYLRQLPLSCIKVDRSFVVDVEHDPQSLVIVKSLLSLGQDLGLDVIVEGIERDPQVRSLLSAGCMLAQGYHFSKPLSVEEVCKLL